MMDLNPALTPASQATWMSHLPPVYARILSRIWSDFELQEQKANCGACPRAAEGLYHRQWKCCTYQPFVPNFLIGAALVEGGEVTRTRLRPWIRREVFHRQREPDAGEDEHEPRARPSGPTDLPVRSLPLGIVPAPAYQREFHAVGPSGFGRSESLLCTFFDRAGGGTCGLWAWRPSHCATFFCESSYGEAGREFWKNIQWRLQALDLWLSQEALLEFGFTLPEIRRQLIWMPGEQAPALGIEESLASEARFWMEFDQEREAFYIRCYEFARTFDVERLQGGPEMWPEPVAPVRERR